MPDLPVSISNAQCDAALEALGIPTGIGLTSLTIGIREVTVTRNVREDGRYLGSLTVQIPRSAPESGADA